MKIKEVCSADDLTDQDWKRLKDANLLNRDSAGEVFQNAIKPIYYSGKVRKVPKKVKEGALYLDGLTGTYWIYRKGKWFKKI